MSIEIEQTSFLPGINDEGIIIEVNIYDSDDVYPNVRFFMPRHWFSSEKEFKSHLRKHIEDYVVEERNRKYGSKAIDNGVSFMQDVLKQKVNISEWEIIN